MRRVDKGEKCAKVRNKTLRTMSVNKKMPLTRLLVVVVNWDRCCLNQARVISSSTERTFQNEIEEHVLLTQKIQKSTLAQCVRTKSSN